MKKPQWLFLGITAVFLCLIIGVFVGRNLPGTYVSVNTTNSADSSDTNHSTQPQDGKIDLNTATCEQLQLIPGVGTVIAQRIVDYRTEANGFHTVEELMNVNGIGEKTFSKIKEYVKISGNYEQSAN